MPTSPRCILALSQTIDATAGLSEGTFREARRLLNAAKAPLENRVAVLHEDAEYEMLGIEKWSTAITPNPSARRLPVRSLVASWASTFSLTRKSSPPADSARTCSSTATPL